MGELERVHAVVIGTGQAGKPLAGALARRGLPSVIIEKGRVGGTCVVEGCTPTKTMVASARVAHLTRRAADYGVRTGRVAVDLEVVRGRKRDIVDSWSSGSEKGMTRHESLELVKGLARFTGPREVSVFDPDDTDAAPLRRFQAEHVFVNAGTRTRIPDLPGLEGVPYLTSTSIMELGTVPSHLLVLGGGFIGLEFGQMFARFGSRVTVLEAGPRLAPREDDDIAQALAEILVEDGLDIRTGAAAARVESDANGIVVVLEDGSSVVGSHLLVATGRRSNADLLDVGAAGLELDARDFLRVDDRCRTSVKGIWALGDVTGAPPFTHIAYDDYRIVESQLFGDGSKTREGRPVPYTLFTDPQLGRIGLTEREARERGHDVRVAKLPMSRVARAIETDETRGLMKAVVDAGTGLILGAAVLGIEGGEIASVLQMAMMGEVRWQAIRDGVFSHPTLAESLNNLFMTLD